MKPLEHAAEGRLWPSAAIGEAVLMPGLVTTPCAATKIYQAEKKFKRGP